MMLGTKKTSPAIASAMSNLAPASLQSASGTHSYTLTSVSTWLAFDTISDNVHVLLVKMSDSVIVAASIVSVPCRLEKFEVECWYSRAKVGGTFVCFSGAVAMSCFHSNSNSPNLTSKEPKLLMKHLDKDTYSDWILGCFYLLAAVVLQLQVISSQIKLYYWRSSL